MPNVKKGDIVLIDSPYNTSSKKVTLDQNGKVSNASSASSTSSAGGGENPTIQRRSSIQENLYNDNPNSTSFQKSFDAALEQLLANEKKAIADLELSQKKFVAGVEKLEKQLTENQKLTEKEQAELLKIQKKIELDKVNIYEKKHELDAVLAKRVDQETIRLKQLVQQRKELTDLTNKATDQYQDNITAINKHFEQASNMKEAYIKTYGNSLENANNQIDASQRDVNQAKVALMKVKEEIQNLELKIRKADLDIKSNAQKLKMMQAKYSFFLNSHQNVNMTLDEEEKLKKMKEAIETLENAGKQLKTNKGTLESELPKLKEKASSLETNLSNIKETYNEITGKALLEMKRADVEVNKAEKQQIEVGLKQHQDILEKEEEIHSTSEEYLSAIRVYDEEIVACSQKLREYQKNAMELNTDISKLERDCGDKLNILKKMETKITSLDNSDIERHRDNMNGDFTERQEDVSFLNSIIEEASKGAQKDLKDFTSRMDTLLKKDDAGAERSDSAKTRKSNAGAERSDSATTDMKY
jgi:chromosome segregation ATPase